MKVTCIYTKNPIERNITLGRAIIHQAMDDVISKNPTMWMEQEQAYNWFFRPNKDFDIICDMADLEPSQVRQRVREIRINPDKHVKRYTKVGQ